MLQVFLSSGAAIDVSEMNDGVTGAVAVMAVLWWHNLFVVASCQGWIKDSPLSCVGCGTCTSKGSKFWTCQSYSHYYLNAYLSLQLKQLKICSMKEEGKKKTTSPTNQKSNYKTLKHQLSDENC